MADHQRASNRKDYSSLSNLNEITTTALDLHLQASFEKQALIGYVTLTVETLVDNVKRIVLDSKALQIDKVQIDGTPVNEIIEKEHPVYGKSLEIPLAFDSLPSGKTFQVGIWYQTTPESEGIQWLSKEQTADKKYPYMFTQCQAIHARSLVPCQDSPSVKSTYTAHISVPTWGKCLMSAVANGDPTRTESGQLEYHFEQKVPIPSYLIAIVIGYIECREIGPRTRVWSESSMIKSAAYEFAQTEDFLRHAEKIMDQPYVWGRYDLVCLPPSFPYGGMENPCLTFVTPTLLAGDRSLADVVAHEIAHSWTGNLITNHTWEHFWLNEGWTMWLQRKIMARVHSDEFFDFDAIIGWTHLSESVEQFGETHPFTALIPNLEGVDPDDSFSSVPYEKGFNFLYYLSKVVGKKPFEDFAKAYVQQFKFNTLTSDDFKQFFIKFFSSTYQVDLGKVDWDAWFYNPGMPIEDPQFDTSISSAAFQLAERWMSNENETSFLSEDMKGWTSLQKVVMLERILNSFSEKRNFLTKERLSFMDSLYQFSATKNAEIRFRWQTLCIRCEADFILPHVEAFLQEQGRMKFIRPLFRDLHKSSMGCNLANELFKNIKMSYHPIAQKMIARDIISQ